jgi:hypothetical protein
MRIEQEVKAVSTGPGVGEIVATFTVTQTKYDKMRLWNIARQGYKLPRKTKKKLCGTRAMRGKYV